MGRGNATINGLVPSGEHGRRFKQLYISMVLSGLLIALEIMGCGSRATNRDKPQTSSKPPDESQQAGHAQTDQKVADATRLSAFDVFWAAYSRFQRGETEAGRDGVKRALDLDPDLAVANMVWAEFAMRESQWDSARVYFERGVSLINDPDQPIAPTSDSQITKRELEGDARCFLGLVYMKCAQQAQGVEKFELEEMYRASAKRTLQMGMQLDPGPEARDIAAGLLKMLD